jgi:hypothetical protein
MLIDLCEETVTCGPRRMLLAPAPSAKTPDYCGGDYEDSRNAMIILALFLLYVIDQGSRIWRED